MVAYPDIVREALVELADVDYQQRVWTGKSPDGQVSSFIENVERLFGDSGLSNA